MLAIPFNCASLRLYVGNLPVPVAGVPELGVVVVSVDVLPYISTCFPLNIEAIKLLPILPILAKTPIWSIDGAATEDVSPVIDGIPPVAPGVAAKSLPVVQSVGIIEPLVFSNDQAPLKPVPMSITPESSYALVYCGPLGSFMINLFCPSTPTARTICPPVVNGVLRSLLLPLPDKITGLPAFISALTLSKSALLAPLLFSIDKGISKLNVLPIDDGIVHAIPPGHCPFLIAHSPTVTGVISLPNIVVNIIA